MPYTNLTLSNIAGEITTTYNDNNMRRNLPADPAVGLRIHVQATAQSGLAKEVFRITNATSTVEEFDSRSEIMQVVTAAKQSNPFANISVSRIGAKPFHVQIKQAIPGSFELDTLVNIQPLPVQEADSAKGIINTLEGLKAVFLPFEEGNLVRQRVIIYSGNRKGERPFVVFDSERLIRIDGDSVFNVELNVPTGYVLYTKDAFAVADRLSDGFSDSDLSVLSSQSSFLLSNVANLNSTTSLASQLELIDMFERTVVSLADAEPAITVSKIDGSAKEHLDHCERYAANEAGYEKLEFENVDFIYCEKCYADTAAVELSTSSSLQEVLDWAKHKLGYFWKFQFNGLPYMYMFGRKDPFAAANVGNYTHAGLSYSFSADQKLVGDLLNLVELHFHAVGGAATSVESFPNDKGLIECHITVNAPSSGEAALVVETPFCSISIAGGALITGLDSVVRLRPSLIGASRAVSDYLLASPERVNNDPFVYGHFALTGELVPEAVTLRLMTFPSAEAEESVELVASAEEVREVSFLHQAATAAYRASTNYSQTIAIVPTSPAPASASGVATWAGDPATYTVQADGAIKVTKNGSGVLGTKLLAGAVDYRDGAAFGGIILTNGDSLPNQTPYGIDDQDEALDRSGNPIDLGKHVVVVGAYGFTPDPKTLFPGQRGKQLIPTQQGSKFGSAGPLIAAILANLAPGTEPIGPVRGRITGFTPQQRTPRAVLDNLAALRVCMVDQTGVISSIYTAALRTSDYSKVSSILSANAIIARLRGLCNSVIGTAYRDEQIASLRSSIDGQMRAMVTAGYAQSITVNLTASQLDRINGVLRASVTFVPPLSIEAVTIDITLAPPAA